MLMQWVILVQCPQNRNSGGFWTALLLFPYKYRWALEVVFGHFSNGFNVGNFCFLQQARYMRYLIDIIDIIYLQNLKLPPTDWQHLKILWFIWFIYRQWVRSSKAINWQLGHLTFNTPFTLDNYDKSNYNNFNFNTCPGRKMSASFNPECMFPWDHLSIF